MPKNVRRFEWIMYATIAMVAAITPFPSLSFQYDLRPAKVALMIAWWAFLAGMVWLTAHRGKNWGRWLLFALFLLDTGMGAWAGVFSYPQYAATWIYRGLTLLNASAYYFVFTGGSGPWFRGERHPDVTVFS